MAQAIDRGSTDVWDACSKRPLLQEPETAVTWKHSLREAFRVDLAPDPAVRELALMREAPRAGVEGSLLSSPLDTPMFACSSKRRIGFGNAHCEDDVLLAFEGVEGIGERALLVLKLGLALLIYGHNTVDAETLLKDVCRGLNLKGANLELSMRSVRCSVGGRSAELLVGKRGVVFDKLVATTRLATHVATVPVDPRRASEILDSIVDRPLPYGWFVQVFCFWGFASMASVTVFSGSYSDAIAVSMIAPFVALIAKVCQYSSLLSKLEGVLIPMFVGLTTPIVWVYVFPGEACRVTIWILACVLFFLPGVQLIYGAYETEFGSVVNGTGRLVAALMRCMFLVMGLTSGWQVYGYHANMQQQQHGYHANTQEETAGLPPDYACPGDVPWQIGTFLFNLPLLLFLCVLFNLRARDLAGPLCFGYLSLAAYGFITHSTEFGLRALPPLMCNFFGVFIAGNLGSLHENLTGTPACLSVLPVVLVYAPGSGAVKSMLSSIHVSMGDFDDFAMFHSNMWGDLVLQGVSYAFGMYLAVVLWRPLNRWKHKARARRYTHRRDDSRDSYAMLMVERTFAHAL